MNKINNKKTALFYTRVVLILLVFLLFSGAALFLLKPTFFFLLSLVDGVSFIILFYAVFKIKSFEYENSLQFITIKQSYFWKIKPAIPTIEFPNDMLIGFDIRQGLFTTYLMLIIKIKEHKTKKLYCKINGLTSGQISELKFSLQHAKEYVEN